ncbi:MAG TPA: hypothetical protein VEH49_04585 [Methylomirabilota bacterium]|nr:hypothetical protein [Methylomirabilota bacterium]
MKALRSVALVVFAASLVAASAQESPDPVATLGRIGQRVLYDLATLPRYTCVQSITRTYYDAPARVHRPTCAKLIEEQKTRKHELRVSGWDRLRLDVALAENRTIFSWAGAPRFSDDTLDKLAGRGPLGSGDFGTFLHEIFLRGTVVFRGEEVADGRHLLDYSYDMPLERSTYGVKAHDGWALTAHHGSLVLDPEAADIIKLVVETAELPEGVPACQATSEVTYGRTPIRERMILIPRETRLRTIDRPGSEASSVTLFANCREYGSSGRMVLDETGGAGENAAEGAPALFAGTGLPAGLRFDTRIVTPIDSDTAAAGDEMEAVLQSPLRDAKKAVIAPAGTRVHGRLIRVEYLERPVDRFEIAVRMESIEIGGKRVALRATSYPPRVRYTVHLDPGAEALLSRFLDPFDSATFFFRADHLRLKHLDSDWVTVDPDTGKPKN